MTEPLTVSAGTRASIWVVSGFLVAFSLQPRPAEAGQSVTVAVACTESALRTAIGQANSAGGGAITFACRDTTIRMTLGLGDIMTNVVIDGEDRNITLAYSGTLHRLLGRRQRAADRPAHARPTTASSAT